MLVSFSSNAPSPRTELLHNIDPYVEPIGEKLYPDSFDNRYRASIRVGDMKLLTGDAGRRMSAHLGTGYFTKVLIKVPNEETYAVLKYSILLNFILFFIVYCSVYKIILVR